MSVVGEGTAWDRIAAINQLIEILPGYSCDQCRAALKITGWDVMEAYRELTGKIYEHPGTVE